MKLEYLFSDTENIFTGLRVDGPYLTFWVDFKERMLNYVNVELILELKIFPKEYTFIGVYSGQSEHGEQYSQLHSDLSVYNPFNWLSNNNIGQHFHFKCTRNGESCEITPHLLKQLLVKIVNYQNNINRRKQFQIYVKEKMPHIPADNIQTQKLYFREEEIDTIYRKSIETDELFLPSLKNSDATINLAIFSVMSALMLYLLCFRNRKSKAENNERVVTQSRHSASEFNDELTNLTAGNGNVSALIALSVLSGSKQSKHFSREMRDQINTHVTKGLHYHH